MKRTLHVILFAMLCCAFAAADTIRPHLKPLPVVSPDLSASLVHPGDTFSVSIMVGGVTDLAGFQFQFSFNPSVISVTSISEGSLLSSGGSTLFSAGLVNNVAGTVGLTAGSLVGGSGVTGTGTLAVIYFTALAPGVSSLDLSNVQLFDAAGAPISFALANGSVTVTPVTAVPEPASLSLLLIGIGPVLARRAWKRRQGNVA